MTDSIAKCQKLTVQLSCYSIHQTLFGIGIFNRWVVVCHKVWLNKTVSITNCKIKYVDGLNPPTWMNCMVKALLPTPPPPTTTNLYELVKPELLWWVFFKDIITSVATSCKWNDELRSLPPNPQAFRFSKQWIVEKSATWTFGVCSKPANFFEFLYNIGIRAGQAH